MQKTLPYRIYFRIALAATFAGTVVSVYLTYLHYKTYTDFAYSSFCALSKSINCDTVAQSPWSVAAGLPVSIWGIFSYLVLLLILSLAKKQDDSTAPIWALLTAVAGCASLVSLYLGYVSSFKIHAYCLLCLSVYAINFLLLFLCWMTRSRFSTRSFLTDLWHSCKTVTGGKRKVWRMTIPLLLLIVTKIVYPQYWTFASQPSTIDLPTGVTESGHPWIGAENPKVTIEEFADYQCFQCAKIHFMLRRLVEQHPDTLRLVHRHYPMDHEFNPTVVQDPFHIGSGKMALLAVYAMSQNKFWQMSDALFQLARSKESFNTKYLSEKTGIPSRELAGALSHPDIRRLLTLDIWQGMKLRITGTPSFVIDGKVYQGTIPLDILKTISP